ncbi:MAG: S8 family serine peptidase, partial [Rubrivivax sp.]|nr:S8 family serine peptidase [Rubrivivax sp.]
MESMLPRAARVALRLAVTTVAAMLASGHVARAAPAAAQDRLAPELRAIQHAAQVGQPTTAAPWRRVVAGSEHVRVLVLAASADPELLALRRAIVAAGGSVHYGYQSVRALAAMVPAAALPQLAARGDVRKVVPDRTTVRQTSAASLVQASTGAGAALNALAPHGSAFDGRGVGIAVLDSGIDARHRAFTDARGASRVRARVDFVTIGRCLPEGGWRAGLDLSPLVRPLLEGGGASIAAALAQPRVAQSFIDLGRGAGVGANRDPARQHERALAESSRLAATFSACIEAVRIAARAADPYGHGTLVAGIAAGRTDAASGAGPDTTGIAPAADLYDVRVIDERGLGTMSDMLAGIDWAIQQGRRHGHLRVLNLSVGADSTESFLVDPLAVAARSAGAAGLVVVAAAGNHGRNA